MSFISTRAVSMPVSPIRRLIPFADAALKQGRTVYHLNIGDPDIKSPDVMIETLQKWNQNPIPYSHSKGQKELIDALISYYQKLHYSLEPQHIQVTIGGSEAIVWAMLILCNPADEILVFEPFYANYASYATISQVTLVPVPTSIKNGFHLPVVSEIEKRITSKTKAILICSPNNPTGTVLSESEMQTIVEVAKKHNLFVLSDEVYREFAYGETKTSSLLKFAKDSMKEKIVILDSCPNAIVCVGRALALLFRITRI